MSPGRNIIGIAGSQYWHTDKTSWESLEAHNGSTYTFEEITAEQYVNFRVIGKTFAVNIEFTDTYPDEEYSDSRQENGALAVYDYVADEYVEWTESFPPPHGNIIGAGEIKTLLIQPPAIYNVAFPLLTSIPSNASFFIHRGAFFCLVEHVLYASPGVSPDMNLFTPSYPPFTSKSCDIVIGSDSIITTSHRDFTAGAGVGSFHSVHTFSVQSYF